MFLEQHTFAGRIADFVWMVMLCVLVLVPIPALVPSIQIPFFGPSLVFTLLYLWSRENPNANTSIMGMITMKAFYLPWGMLGMGPRHGPGSRPRPPRHRRGAPLLLPRRAAPQGGWRQTHPNPRLGPRDVLLRVWGEKRAGADVRAREGRRTRGRGRGANRGGRERRGAPAARVHRQGPEAGRQLTTTTFLKPNPNPTESNVRSKPARYPTRIRPVRHVRESRSMNSSASTVIAPIAPIPASEALTIVPLCHESPSSIGNAVAESANDCAAGEPSPSAHANITVTTCAPKPRSLISADIFSRPSSGS